MNYTGKENKHHLLRGFISHIANAIKKTLIRHYLIDFPPRLVLLCAADEIVTTHVSLSFIFHIIRFSLPAVQDLPYKLSLLGESRGNLPFLPMALRDKQ